MTFTEAVRELAEGRCEGIKRENMDTDIVSKAGIYADPILVWYCEESLWMNTTFYLADDWQLVNYKPQMKEVEIKRWFCTCCHSVHDNDCHHGCITGELILLTGTYQRPVPRMVKRREEIAPDDLSTWHFVGEDNAKPIGNFKFYAEWTEEAAQ